MTDIKVESNMFKYDVHLHTFMVYMFGKEKTLDMCEHLLSKYPVNEFFLHKFIDMCQNCSREQARPEILHKITSSEEYFTHCMQTGWLYFAATMEEKLTVVQRMMCKVMLHMQARLGEYDKDSLVNKRVESRGDPIHTLLRKTVMKMSKDCRFFLNKCSENGKNVQISSILNHKMLSGTMKYALSTGNFLSNLNKNTSTATNGKKGVSQLASGLNKMSIYSHVRRVSSSMHADAKLPKPRQLHESMFGFVCPSETPEGQSCGLIRNLSMLVHVTAVLDPWMLQEQLRCSVDRFESPDRDTYLVSDGVVISTCCSPDMCGFLRGAAGR